MFSNKGFTWYTREPLNIIVRVCVAQSFFTTKKPKRANTEGATDYSTAGGVLNSVTVV